MATRKRRFGSLATELVKKARKQCSALSRSTTIRQIEFKSELFIVTTVIAWTYLLYSYYKKRRIDYRQVDDRVAGKRRKFLRTRRGAIRHWSLAISFERRFLSLQKVSTSVGKVISSGGSVRIVRRVPQATRVFLRQVGHSRKPFIGHRGAGCMSSHHVKLIHWSTRIAVSLDVGQKNTSEARSH